MIPLIMALAVLFAPSALAAEPPSEVQNILQSAPQTVEDAFGWTVQDILSTLTGMTKEALQEPAVFMLRAVLYLVASGAVGLVVSGRWRSCVDSVAVLGFGAMSLHAMAELVASVGKTAADCHVYLISFAPVYGSVAALAGQTAGGALYSGMFLAMSAFLAGAIEHFLLPVMQVYFCLATCAALWGSAGIEQAAALFARCITVLLKGCGALFGIVLGLQNLLAGNVDSAALKCGQSILQGVIPVVGDAASAALSGALSAVRLLKGSLALAAILVLGAAFLPILFRCGLYFVAFSAAGIAAGACGSGQCGRLCRLYAQGAGLCASVLTLYFFMVFLSTALLLILGNAG